MLCTKPRWLLALPVAMAVMLGASGAQASTIRDTAGMFSPDAVRQAQAQLDKIEREYQLPVTIETIETLDGEPVAEVAIDHAKRSGTHGIYILIAKREKAFDIAVSKQYQRALDKTRERAIRAKFLEEFKAKDFDAGLLAGVKAIGTESAEARATYGTLRENVPAARRVGVPLRRGAGGGGFGLGSLVGIALAIVGVLFVVRLLGSLFGGAAGAGMGGPGRMGAGYGGGYGGGGGFMSSLFGGLGGALAGNWLYDQFSGRHHGGYGDSTSYDQGSVADPGAPADDWSGGNVSGGWGDSGGDGGGDWGGSGGDWGGGGGDWGGGGGGDW
jgi:uncharacterized protein